MPAHRYVAWECAFCLVACSAAEVCAENYPSKPVRIVTSEAGGGGDFGSRVIAQGLTTALGQQVIVDNRGGSGGAFAIEIVSKAPQDGYTLLGIGSSLWLLQYMRDRVSWDPVRDFAPVSLATTSPQLLLVHPSLPAKTVTELIALARARPGELNYASSATGSATHLAGEIFNAMAQVKTVHVPYKGSGLALSAVISAEVQMMFPAAAAGIPHAKSGRLRALAITSAKPSALLPGMPTVSESGLPGYEAVSIIGIFAPAKTSGELIARLNGEIVRVLNRADVKEKFFNAGVEVVASSPQQFAVTIKSEMASRGKLIKDAGIRAD